MFFNVSLSLSLSISLSLSLFHGFRLKEFRGDGGSHLGEHEDAGPEPPAGPRGLGRGHGPQEGERGDQSHAQHGERRTGDPLTLCSWSIVCVCVCVCVCVHVQARSTSVNETADPSSCCCCILLPNICIYVYVGWYYHCVCLYKPSIICVYVFSCHPVISLLATRGRQNPRVVRV